MNLKKIFLLLLLTSCIAPLPPCEGTEEQIFRCESLRLQNEQLRRTKMLQLQQNNLFWDNWRKEHVQKRYGY